MNKIRLNKFLSECGVASRRKSEEFIKQGRVQVNNEIVTQLSVSIDTENDVVSLDGEIIKTKKHVYYVLNKPKGVVTTTNDERKRTTVVDLINTKEKIFPVGRLDYNTTGVLILTNDGNFSNFLTHPSNKVSREYEVQLNKPLAEVDEKKLLKGIFLEGSRGRFEQIRFLKGKRDLINVITFEGRNHFVKNMLKALGYLVESLERKSFAGITVKGIPKGSYIILSNYDINGVYKKYA